MATILPSDGFKYRDTNSQQLRQVPGQGLSTYDISYSSYAGVDIVAQIILPNQKPIVLGELQTISYSIHRENSPVRFVGHVSPAGFVKGPRTIAGSLIFTVFNSYAFYRLEKYQQLVMSNNQTLYPLADMLPPFDVNLTFSNETGSFSKMGIYGITIVDEGQTMSIDDLVTEQTYTYMARGIQPMTHFIPDNVTRSIAATNQYETPRNILRFT